MGKTNLSYEVKLPDKVIKGFTNLDGTWKYSFFKVLHGGRGSAKSESFARLLIGVARSKKGRILCARQYMNSIADSVYQSLVDAIYELGVQSEFKILDTSIQHLRTGTDFIFKGFQRSIMEIKSMKGLILAFVEEAEQVSAEAWQILEPTMRGSNDAEIWVAFNPEREDSPIYRMAVKNPRPDAIVIELNWRDNPWFPEILERQRVLCLTRDPDNYDWIWEGKLRKISDAQVFKNKWSVEDFVEHQGVRPLYGLDFGFSNDPTAGVRLYAYDESLYITHEAGGIGIENDDIVALLTGEKYKDQFLPDVVNAYIKADSARPETISYLRHHGLPRISAAEKWAGSVEDGISFIKAFKHVYIHPRCKQVAQEFRLYSHKVDKKTLDADGKPQVLTDLVDANNHFIDAIRYSFDGQIIKSKKAAFGKVTY